MEELKAINQKELNEPEPTPPGAAPLPAVAATAAQPVAAANTGAAAQPQARTTPLAPSDLLPPAQRPGPSRPLDPEAPVQPAPRRDVWGESLAQLREIARNRAGEPGESAGLWPLRSRVLDWVAEAEGNDSDSLLWTTGLRALTAASRREATDDQALATAVHAAVEALEDRTPLEISDLRLCRKILAFGKVEPLDREPCRPGQVLILYCEMSGLKYEPAEDGFRSRLASQVELVPSGGGRPAWKHSLPTAEDVCQRRRRDVYVSHKITLPKDLAPGAYEIRLTQNDLISGRAASRSIALTIQR
jgi:hypothetical protein